MQSVLWRPPDLCPWHFLFCVFRINWANAQVQGQMSLRPVGIIRNLLPSLFMWTPSDHNALRSSLWSLREKQAPNQIANVQNNSLQVPGMGPSLHIDMWDIMGLFCPNSNGQGLCPMATGGPLMPSRFGPNNAILLGRALGLMNSSASWRP